MQTPFIHIMAPPNQSPVIRPIRTDIVQKERKKKIQNQRDIGQIMKRIKWSSWQELQRLWTHK